MLRYIEVRIKTHCSDLLQDRKIDRCKAGTAFITKTTSLLQEERGGGKGNI